MFGFGGYYVAFLGILVAFLGILCRILQIEYPKVCRILQASSDTWRTSGEPLAAAGDYNALVERNSARRGQEKLAARGNYNGS